MGQIRKSIFIKKKQERNFSETQDGSTKLAVLNLKTTINPLKNLRSTNYSEYIEILSTQYLDKSYIKKLKINQVLYQYNTKFVNDILMN